MHAPRTVNGQHLLGFQALVKIKKPNLLAFMCLVVGWLTTTANLLAQADPRAKAFKNAHDWVDPLAIPPLLSGNFGELRGNHFHTGVDLKTEGREGLPVLAATDGNVARVKMSPWGYGNALYLDGPDGITTVYAHLQRFAPEIQAWAIERTYAGRTLGLDAAPPSSAGLVFQAGDTLGWSGNSGGSGGPHLHFEVRRTDNQHPLNPLDGWLTKTDTRPPVLRKLWLETPHEWYSVPLPSPDTLMLEEQVRFSVEGFDLLDGASNVCGLRVLEARLESVSGELLLEHRASWGELDFGVNKDMNAHAFYPVWSEERDQVHRLHRFSTNHLGIYTTPVQDGWVNLAPGEVATLFVRAEDAAGNETAVQLVCKGGKKSSTKPASLEADRVLKADASGSWRGQGFECRWEAGTVFEDAVFRCEVDAGGQHLNLRPLHVPYRKSIHVAWPAPQETHAWEGSWIVLPGHSPPKDRWVAVTRAGDGEIDDVQKATWTGTHWSVDLPHGGAWGMERDTVPAKVIPYHSGTPLVANGDAVWYVDDALSGVESVELSLDGVWARIVWDPKRNMVTYEASDQRHPRGKACLVRLVVADEVGNVTTWERELTWP